MSITTSERRFLKVFLDELHAQGANGWLDLADAAHRSGVSGEAHRMAARLAARGLLIQSRDGPFFSISRFGAHALRPWWHRRFGLLLGAVAFGLVVLMVVVALGE